MKPEEFQTRYNLAKRLTKKGIRSYEATDPGGRPVMVHVLGVPAAKAERLLELLAQLDPESKTAIIEVFDVESTPVVVTRVLEDFESLPGWLKSRIKVTEAGAPQGDTVDEPGEFTRLFMAAADPETPPDAAAFEEPATGVPDAEPALPEPEAAEAGEFTGLFGPVSEPPPASEAPPRPQEPPATATPEPSEPDDFTGLFGPAQPEIPEPPEPERPEDRHPEPEPEPKEPGDFTRLFGVEQKPEAAAPPPTGESKQKKPVIRWRETAPEQTEPQLKPVVRWKKGKPLEPEPPPPLKPEGPGEFTKLFRPAAETEGPPPGQLKVPESPRPASPLDRPTHDYLKALDASVPVREEGPGSGGPPPPVPPPVIPPSAAPPVDAPPATPPPPTKDGPSEFTLVVSGGTQRPEASGSGSALDSSEYEAPPRAAPSTRVLLMGLGGILLLIILLVVLFAVL